MASYSLKKYDFTSSALFLSLYFSAAFAVLLIHAPKPSIGEWVGQLFWFINFDHFGKFSLLTFITAIIAINALLLHKINSGILGIGKEKLFLPLLYLILCVISPGSLNVSGALLASPFFLYSIHNTLYAHKSERSLFLTGIFLSGAIVFEPRFILLSIVPMIFLFTTKMLKFREIVIFVISFIIPSLTYLSIYQLLNGDFLHLIVDFGQMIITREGSAIIEETPVGYVILLVYFLLVVSAMFRIVQSINRVKIIKAMTLYRIIALFIGIVIIYLIYPKILSGIAPLLAFPLSIIIGERVASRDTAPSYRVLFFVLLILVSVKFIYEFI